MTTIATYMSTYKRNTIKSHRNSYVKSLLVEPLPIKMIQSGTFRESNVGPPALTQGHANCVNKVVSWSLLEAGGINDFEFIQ